MSELDFRAQLHVLNENGVEFVVIGGVAVGAHGFMRATRDLDLVPDRASANLKRLSRALAALESTLPRAGGRRYEPARDEGPLHAGASMTLQTRYGGLDIVQRVPGAPSFGELQADAVSSELLGEPVRICSLEHLRRMKRARGTDRDRVDLAALEDLSR